MATWSARGTEQGSRPACACSTALGSLVSLSLSLTGPQPMVPAASIWGRKCCFLLVLRKIGALFPVSSSFSRNCSAPKSHPIYSSIADSSLFFSRHYSTGSIKLSQFIFPFFFLGRKLLVVCYMLLIYLIAPCPHLNLDVDACEVRISFCFSCWWFTHFSI